MSKFSVVIPVYSGPYNNENHFRAYRVQRAIRSVQNQQFPDWELIVVDDGSVDGMTPQVLDKMAEADKRIKVIHTENLGRAYARNTGMEAASGEWLCWLDSDDEYLTHYLRELDQATKDFPEYKIFNFGSIVHFEDHSTRVRDTFKPAVEGEGHEWFRAGRIGAGSFIFRRDLWNSDPKYRIPNESSPYHFAAASKFPMRFTEDEPYVENPTEAFQDGVYRHGLSLGNPWGDDALQAYLLTRDNQSKPLDVLLYVQYARSHEEIYDHYGEIYTMEDIIGETDLSD